MIDSDLVCDQAVGADRSGADFIEPAIQVVVKPSFEIQGE